MWRLLPFLLALEEQVEDSEPKKDEKDTNNTYQNRTYSLPEIKQEKELEAEAEGDRHVGEPDLEVDVEEGKVLDFPGEYSASDGKDPSPKFADSQSVFDYNEEDLNDDPEPQEGGKELVNKAYDVTEEQVRDMREKAANDNQRTGWERFKTGVKNLPYQALNAVSTLAGTPVAVYENHKTKGEIRDNPGTEKQIMYIEHGLGQTRGSGIVMARQARKEGYLPILVKGNHGIDDPEEKLQSKYDQIASIHEETGLENVANRNDIYRGHSSGGNSTIHLGSDPRTLEHGIKYGQALGPAPYGINPKSFTQRMLLKLLPNASKEDVRTDEGKQYAVEMAGKRPVIPIQVVAGEHDAGVRPEDAVYRHATDTKYVKGPGSTHFRTSHTDPRTNRQTLDYLKEFMQSIKDEAHPEAGMRYDPSTGFVDAASNTPRPENYEPATGRYELPEERDKAA